MTNSVTLTVFCGFSFQTRTQQQPPQRREESEPEPMSEPEPSMAVYKAASPSLTPATRATPVRSPSRSRASSVTEAVNALRMSVMGHIDHDDADTDSSHSSKPASPRWTADRRSAKPAAPEPAAGDVMFFPAGKHVETERHVSAPDPAPVPAPAPEPESHADPEYVYSKSIRVSQGQEPPEVPVYSVRDPAPAAPEEPVSQHTGGDPVYSYSKVIRQSTRANQGYEVPNQLRQTTPASYETEHGRPVTQYSQNLGATMSDRLTALVEDGDKTRFSHYNIGATNFGPEDDDDEPVQMRRPRTPPVDIPRSSLIYSRPGRPATPPNDIPLITPRESTEIPPLNLRSSMASPRSPVTSPGRPSTPPKDFPITPKSSVVRPRPSTPPFDAETARSTTTNQIPTAQTSTNQIPTDTARSAPIDPSTGEPGSFQARQRLIEAHLMKNVSGNQLPDKTASIQAKKTETPAPPKFEIKSTPAPPPPPPAFPPGFIPPPPPPPPLPK